MLLAAGFEPGPLWWLAVTLTTRLGWYNNTEEVNHHYGNNSDLWLGEATEKLRTAVTAAEMCFPLTSKFKFHAALDVCVETMRKPFFTLALQKSNKKKKNSQLRSHLII